MVGELGKLWIRLGFDPKVFKKSVEFTQKELKRLKRNFQKDGKDLQDSLTKPLLAFGVTATLASREYNKASAIIRRGTGAVGKELDALKINFDNVFKTGDDSATEVAETLTELSTKTGLTGSVLEELTTTMLDLNDVAGGDLKSSVRDASRLFAEWNLATEEQIPAMDTLYKVSQQTGTGINSLLSNLVKYAPSFKAFGFNLSESAVFLGQMEKAGLNTDKMLSGLTKGFATLTKAGLDPKKVFTTLIEDFKKTGNEAQLLQRSFTIFGSKAGGEFANAVKSGRLEFSELLKTISESKETIAEASKASETFDQKLLKIKNSVTGALRPLGDEIVNTLMPVFDRLVGIINSIGVAFANLSPEMRQTIIVIGAVVASLGPVIIALGTIAGALALLVSPIGLVITGFVALALSAYAFKDDIKIAFDNALKIIEDFYYDTISYLKALKNYLSDFGSSLTFQNGLILFNKQVKSFSESLSEAQAETAKYRAEQEKKIVTEKTGSKITEIASKALEKMKDITGKIIPVISGAGAGTEDFAGQLDALGNKGSKIDDLKKKIEELKQEISETSLKNALDKAIEVNGSNFAELKQQFLSATYNGVIQGLDESVRNSDSAKEYAQLTVDKLEQEIDDRYQESLTEAHKKSVDQWKTFFENAITGVKFDFEDMMKQVAVGFASELASSLAGSLGGLDLSSPQNLGASLGQSILSAFSSGGGGLFGGARPEGVSGPLLENGSFTPGIFSSQGGIFSGAGGTAGYATALLSSLDAISQIGKSSKQTAMGIAETAGSAIGASLGGPVGAMIGNQIGKFAGKGIVKAFGLGGSTNKETLAREAFAEKLNDMLKAVGGINIGTSDGGTANLSTIDIFGGSSKFTGGNGAGFEFFNTLGQNAQSLFKTLGIAFKEIFELEDLPVEQAGAILAENLLGSIDNARLAVQKLGLDFDTLKTKFFELARNGEISWLEFNSAVRDLGEAFKPGLEKLADVSTALNNLKRNGGRGFESVKDIRDVAQETLEAGGKSLAQMEQILVANGASLEEASKIIQAVQGRGVEDVQQLANASEELAGSIVGDLDALGFGFAEVSKEVLSVKSALEEIDRIELKAKTLEVKIKKTGDVDVLEETENANPQTAPAFTRSNFGNRLNQRNFKLGASEAKQLIINVNVASGATANKDDIEYTVRSVIGDYVNGAFSNAR